MESAKIKALVYADIFDYPLTEAELEKWKIAAKPLTINHQQQTAESSAGFYYLRGRQHIVNIRKRRAKISVAKLDKAQQATCLLRRVPTVIMIALTGGLAMQNSQQGDDIDMLIIAKRGTLWLTRFLSTFILDAVRTRRRPNDKHFINKICLNMFLEDGYLTLPNREQDLYGAHEVYQIKPLFDRNGTYQKFLQANSWAGKFLPDGMSRSRNQELGIREKREKLIFIILNSLFIIPELLAKFFQLLYMNRHRTTEVISSHMLRFHPKDYRLKVLQEYQKKMKAI